MTSRHPRFPRYVTACQQLLVLGVVCAALTPAADTVSLELAPQGPPQPAQAGSGQTYALRAARPGGSAVVPGEVVEPTVREYRLTAPAGARVRPGAMEARSRPLSGRQSDGTSRLVSTPQPVSGYGVVGVTWEPGTRPAEDDVEVAVRTRDGGDWSRWTPMVYHAEHGPDPGSAEARTARPGTDEMLVGDVDDVQVRVVTDNSAPPDARLAVVDPGTATISRRQPGELRTGEDATRRVPAARARARTGYRLPSAVTARPRIFSRKQWGADERLRDGPPRYYEVHAGFVHHTVNANGYRKRDVPAILRGIYAYHTRSRGWSDIGYNFLVDRFGRIWEGRAGGVDRPVVGAHTLGYNDHAFAMSAIGNFEQVRPSWAMVKAFGSLFAWKLSLHGVQPGSTRQRAGSRTIPAISGHRDVGATACPGRHLHSKIPQIRRLAARAQQDFSGRHLQSDIARSDHPDVLVRRKSDGHGYVIPIKPRKDGSGFKAGRAIDTRVDLSGTNRFFNAGDWDRDGRADMVVRRDSDGALLWHRGRGNGRFGRARPLATGFGRVGLLSAVGDMTGDGWPDLMGQPRGKPMMIYPGRGDRGLGRGYVAHSRLSGNRQLGIGLWSRDGAPDTLVRRGPTLSLWSGNGPGGLTTGRRMGIDVEPYSWVLGIGDVGLTGHPDLVVRKRGKGGLYLIEGSRRGFGKPRLLGWGMRRYDQIS